MFECGGYVDCVYVVYIGCGECGYDLWVFIEGMVVDGVVVVVKVDYWGEVEIQVVGVDFIGYQLCVLFGQCQGLLWVGGVQGINVLQWWKIVVIFVEVLYVVVFLVYVDQLWVWGSGMDGCVQIGYLLV